jgi:peptide/nickel transport system substrate-binding protein
MTDSTIGRRQLVKAIGVAGATGLAGCGGEDGGGGDGGTGDGSDGGGSGGQSDGDLGERVPAVIFNYWSDEGPLTDFFEDAVSIIQQDIQELGVSLETNPTTLSSGIGGEVEDGRDWHFSFGGYALRPARLDPGELTQRYHIMAAGENSSWNPSNYADCEYSQLASEQRRLGNEEERRATVTEAHSILSEDVGIIPVVVRMQYGAMRTDVIDVNGIGEMGIMETGIVPLLKSSPAGDADALRTNVPAIWLESTIFPKTTDASTIYAFSNTVYSPLMMYDENFELEQVLASSFESANNGQQFTVELRDASFHNGEPITAEDVKWTFEFLAEQARNGTYTWPTDPGYESIEVIDDSTVQFNMENPSPTMDKVIIPSWGILPKDAWQEAGAEENPTDFEDPWVGSGPYRITDFEQGRLMGMEPFEDHPKFDPEGDLVFQVFNSSQAAYRAFTNNEINVLMTTTPSLANQVRQNMGDSARVITTQGFTPYFIHPQTPFGPSKFREFRMAFSQIIDRQNINQTALYGDSEPMVYADMITSTHPWYPGDDNLTQIAASPSTNPDRGRQILEDAGWGWDGNGRLHYPPDADLSPRWPQGSEPAEHPDRFPCVSELENPF